MVARRPTGADPYEEAGLDELCEIVGCLGAADPGELLISGARQIGRVDARQRSERQLLRRFELPRFEPSSVCHEAP